MYTVYRTTCDHREHLKLFFRSLFHLLTVLNLVDKDLGGFKTRNKMFFDHQSSIPGNVPGNLAFPFLVDKASETTYIDIIAIGHRILHNAKKRLHRCSHVSLIHSGLFCDFVDYICFSHFVYF